jgi:hypothetical protein
MPQLLSPPRKQALFVLLSLADLALTWWLLGHSDGQVYEANPLARWWLARGGWAGLALFKVGTVVVVVALSALIACWRPRTADRLLGVSCAGMACVVLYSIALCRLTAWSEAAAEAELAATFGDWNRQSAREARDRMAFEVVRDELCAQLADGSYSLRETTERLERADRGRTSLRLALDAMYPDRRGPEQMAAYAIWHTVQPLQDDPPTAWRTALRLEREFAHTYGCPPPRGHRRWLKGTEPEAHGADPPALDDGC